MRQKILIDTDPGQDIDDLLAIWFALLRPELDVVGITTVTWPTVDRARLIKRLLRFLNRADVPVVAGQDYPTHEMSDADKARLHDRARSMNHASFAEPLDARDDPGDANAVDLIIRTVEAHPGQVTLACIAPLTNVATALRRKPQIAPMVKRIILMGGETTLNRKENNVAVDYLAARDVFVSGIPIAMGTWDVTQRFVLTLAECEELFRKHNSPVSVAMADAIKVWHPAQSWKPGPVMYDLFPMVHAFDRSYYTTQPMSVRVETAGEFTRGMTVPGGDATHIEVTTDVRFAELRELYLATVLG
jgi:purine nucleosidase